MRTPTRILSLAMLLLGLAIIVRTVAEGGGPLAFGLLVGLLLMAAGAGRLYVERER